MTNEKIEEQCIDAKYAALNLLVVSTEQKNEVIELIAKALENNQHSILKENEKDVENYKKRSPDATFLDRLTLNKKRIADMVDGIRQIAKLHDPVHDFVPFYNEQKNTFEKERVLQNGLTLQKMRAPLGVIGVIYEARPNVTADVAALCIKSGNAVVLRGGSDAINTNREIYNIIKAVLKTRATSFENAVQFIDDTRRDSTLELLKQGKYVDVVIPRGGNGLRDFVIQNATMPVIASGGGNCHVYVDEFADLKKAENIVLNAKLQRPSVCNAMEHLIVHEKVAQEFLPNILKKLKFEGVEIRGDEATNQIFKCDKLAVDEDFANEFEKLIITVRIVDKFVVAIAHINLNSTKHSDTIVTENIRNANLFKMSVDSAAVYVNASTRFTDGFEFGLGAEIGISTQKLHVRGPIGLEELTSVKYVITGNDPEGNIRK